MKSVGICPSTKKTAAHQFIMPIAKSLEKRGATVYIDEDFVDQINLPKLDKEVDLIITLGGDGTLLYYKRKYASFKETIYTAANIGRLGFMADVHMEQFDDYFNDIFNQEYSVEERMMLQTLDPTKKSHAAVNDIVFHRGSNPSMIELKVSIDDVYFNTFQADGLIISTPTGSTAYTLAAGGPLVHPTIPAIIMTPICGHTLSSRPFVSHPNSVIDISLQSTKGPAEVTIDGIEHFLLEKDHSCQIKTHSETFKMLTYPKRHSFFSTLRDKLHWRGMSTPSHIST